MHNTVQYVHIRISPFWRQSNGRKFKKKSFSNGFICLSWPCFQVIASQWTAIYFLISQFEEIHIENISFHKVHVKATERQSKKSDTSYF